MSKKKKQHNKPIAEMTKAEKQAQLSHLHKKVYERINASNLTYSEIDDLWKKILTLLDNMEKPELTKLIKN